MWLFCCMWTLQAEILPQCFTPSPQKKPAADDTPVKQQADMEAGLALTTWDDMPLPCWFAPSQQPLAFDVAPVQSTRFRKPLLKRPAAIHQGNIIPMLSITKEVNPGAELCVKIDGKRVYICTLHASSWGETFAEDAKEMSRVIQEQQLSVADAKALRKTFRDAQPCSWTLGMITYNWTQSGANHWVQNHLRL